MLGMVLSYFAFKKYMYSAEQKKIIEIWTSLWPDVRISLYL